MTAETCDEDTETDSYSHRFVCSTQGRRSGRMTGGLGDTLVLPWENKPLKTCTIEGREVSPVGKRITKTYIFQKSPNRKMNHLNT